MMKPVSHVFILIIEVFTLCVSVISLLDTMLFFREDYIDSLFENRIDGIIRISFLLICIVIMIFQIRFEFRWVGLYR